MKLLLIADDQKLMKEFTGILKRNGYIVDIAKNGDTGLEMALEANHDLIVLERVLPSQDGITIIKELRDQGIETPVMLLSPIDTSADLVIGLDSGADYYLVKPFCWDELLAGLRALARRKGKGIQDPIIKAAGLCLDSLKCEVVKESGRETIKLSRTETLLLELLMRNCGQVVTKGKIYETIWGYYSQIHLTSINFYIYSLRAKLKSCDIRTVRGTGYYLKE